MRKEELIKFSFITILLCAVFYLLGSASDTFDLSFSKEISLMSALEVISIIVLGTLATMWISGRLNDNRSEKDLLISKLEDYLNFTEKIYHNLELISKENKPIVDATQKKITVMERRLSNRMNTVISLSKKLAYCDETEGQELLEMQMKLWEKITGKVGQNSQRITEDDLLGYSNTVSEIESKIFTLQFKINSK